MMCLTDFVRMSGNAHFSSAEAVKQFVVQREGDGYVCIMGNTIYRIYTPF